MIYVALLRGINVGGNNKVDMKELKKTFEEAGMSAVKTYINSGNIIFADDQHAQDELPSILEAAILSQFDLSIKVLVYSIEEFRRIAGSLPETWTNDQDMKSDVWFLWPEADNAAVLDELTIKPEIDRVNYVPGAVLWSVDKAHAAKSGMQKVIGTKLYKLVTIRNVNTVRKLLVLMEETSAD
ncbi:DUF1697 domain-containing protein [Planomicrobium okeanokoites]|uniref:DUF1697 domain-containing protein n=1 Tax=Planomicrobium okeanokoites TaxID=244 RepID=A0ABV7KKV7_PLAOK|nr:DUF1697 domain-containing protein [Planomicrobium okeanokoites]TAA69505.1 DUF1697 domain-containing protein [Planomicrobium okeanokoites]